MNLPVLIVAGITLLAFVAHLFIGTRETASILPDRTDPKLTTHWVQAMCAFQMLSVDLLLVAGVLFAVAIWDLGTLEPTIILAAIAVYLLWGLAWIIQMVWLKHSQVRLLALPQWLIWFACAALLGWGYSLTS